ncbi:YCF48-related protein, partial [Candidatus Pacearchaeota archaeon]|nr:YCF48-related protein [Candidatus Pacearchaeota archaeon]
LPATWGNAITDAALIAALSTLAAWSDLTNITISGVHTGGAARAYSSTTVKDSDVEVGGVVTLTPEGPTRSIVVYEDNSYADEIATYSPTIWGGDTYELTDTNYLDTLNILAGHNPADTNFHEVINGSLVYPSTSGLTPRFPTGTTKVKRTIRNDAAVASAITIDDLWFGSVERISDHRAEGAMGLRTLSGDVKGNLAALADVHISATTFNSLWTEVYRDIWVTWRGVSAFDATHVWAVGHNSAAGDDGAIVFYDGLNWTPQVSGVNYTLYDVCAISTTVAWAVGSNGTILKTTDGGANWVPQVSGTTKILHGVVAFDVNTVYVVGDTGTILKTTDGGANWVAQVSGTTQQLLDVSLTDATHAIAIGDAGTILKTTDGTNWAAPASGTTDDLYGVSYLDATHAWAVGDNGTIVFSGDAGVTWGPQTSNTTQTISAVWSADSTHIWATSGDVLFSNGVTWTAQTGVGAGYGIEGISNSSIWVVGGAMIFHGVAAAAPMTCTDVTFGQNNNYSENWNPVLDAVGATQTALTTRRRSSYRQMVAAATETFLFNVKAHQGTHMITAGVSLGAADAKDTFDLTFKLQTTGGTDITTQTTTASLHLLFSGAETYTATEFLEICKIAFPRLGGLTIPSEGLSTNAEWANVNQVVIVTADAALATTLWLDYIALVPTWAKVEVTSWAYNTMILDSRSLKAVLASLDGSLDTAQIYDSTKVIGIPKFTADPNGGNYTIVCVNNVAGDDRATFIPDVKLVYNPTYLLVGP